MGIKRTVLIRPIGSRVLSSFNKRNFFQKLKKLKSKFFLCIFGEIPLKNVCAIGGIKIFTNRPKNWYTTYYWYIAQWETTSLFLKFQTFYFLNNPNVGRDWGLGWGIGIGDWGFVFGIRIGNWDWGLGLGLGLGIRIRDWNYGLESGIGIGDWD